MPELDLPLPVDEHNAVAHVVGFERGADLLDDLLVRRDLTKGHRQGGGAQSIQMLLEFEDLALIQA